MKKIEDIDNLEANTSRPLNFIRNMIEKDLAENKHETIVTRFPPEPNGYLHIGHAKSICLNFEIAKDYKGLCNLRFDDTNPIKEDLEYVQSIQEDIKWLGFDWGHRLFYASDYFQSLYDYAENLIMTGHAYVCDLSPEELKRTRGTLTEPGENSPYRDRPAQESLDLFRRMKNGEFPDGSRLLRAKIDMASPNMNLRDPAIYRIRKTFHHRTGNLWNIYPMYDYAHAVSDAIEGVTHSLCTLEFEDHRPLYEWFLEKLDWPQPRPKQTEFARLNLEYTMMSKRKLLTLVQESYVDGWNDPRLPTISALRKRGYTPESIRLFCDRIGLAKRDSWIEYEWLEKAVRDDLHPKAPRIMAVLKPLKVTIENWAAGETKTFTAPYFPDDLDNTESRELVLSKEIYIDQDDFMLDPPKKYYRLAPGREVKLRWAGYLHCQEAILDSNGQVTELKCLYSEEPHGLGANQKKKPAIIHWVPASLAQKITVRLYDRLFKVPRPQGDLDAEINPNSLITLKNAYLEPAVAKNLKQGERFQFERLGYFIHDVEDSKNDELVFNRITTLKDSWAKIQGGNKD